MQRRDFLRMASAGGVVIPTWALLPVAQAQSALYAGKVLINIHADGGMDQSSWADPRETDGTLNNYAAAGTAGGRGGQHPLRAHGQQRRVLRCALPPHAGHQRRAQ